MSNEDNQCYSKTVVVDQTYRTPLNKLSAVCFLILRLNSVKLTDSCVVTGSLSQRCAPRYFGDLNAYLITGLNTLNFTSSNCLVWISRTSNNSIIFYLCYMIPNKGIIRLS